MTQSNLATILRKVVSEDMPLPGAGETAKRHMRLMRISRQNLDLARLAEGHWDAIAILAEASRQPVFGAIYGVWASESSGHSLSFTETSQGLNLSGTKYFCTGAGLIDHALVTVVEPQKYLIDVDLRRKGLRYDFTEWKNAAFRAASTATTYFDRMPIEENNIVGEPHWYTQRIGFWHGACGPAACWAGGCQGLLDYALQQSRKDPHTLAHLGAMHADCWLSRSVLETAGHEIDCSHQTIASARILALTVRQAVEQASSDILRRFARAYGPRPLIFDEEIALRYQGLDLYLRQSHAERDLEALGESLKVCRELPIYQSGRTN